MSHKEFTPVVTMSDAQVALLALATDVRAVVNNFVPDKLDWGCRMKAGGIVMAYAGQLLPHDNAFGTDPFPVLDESCALALEAAAMPMSDPANAIDWRKIIQIIMAILSVI